MTLFALMFTGLFVGVVLGFVTRGVLRQRVFGLPMFGLLGLFGACLSGLGDGGGELLTGLSGQSFALAASGAAVMVVGAACAVALATAGSARARDAARHARVAVPVVSNRNEPHQR